MNKQGRGEGGEGEGGLIQDGGLGGGGGREKKGELLPWRFKGFACRLPPPSSVDLCVVLWCRRHTC